MHNTKYCFLRLLCGVVKHHAALPVMQSQISKQDSQIKSLLAERSSLAAQMEAMQGDLQTATSLADQQVSLMLSLLCHSTAPTCLPTCLAKKRCHVPAVDACSTDILSKGTQAHAC